MNIGEKVKKSASEFICKNLTNKDMIYRAYILDCENNSTPRYFWYYFIPLIISFLVMVVTFAINDHFLKGNVWTLLVLLIFGIYQDCKRKPPSLEGDEFCKN